MYFALQMREKKTKKGGGKKCSFSDGGVVRKEAWKKKGKNRKKKYRYGHGEREKNGKRK